MLLLEQYDFPAGVLINCSRLSAYYAEGCYLALRYYAPFSFFFLFFFLLVTFMFVAKNIPSALMGDKRQFLADWCFLA